MVKPRLTPRQWLRARLRPGPSGGGARSVHRCPAGRGTGAHGGLLAGGLVPPRGFRPKTPWMRWLFFVLRPLFPLLRWLLPSLVITPERLTRAMLKALRGQAGKPRLEPRDLNALGMT